MATEDHVGEPAVDPAPPAAPDAPTAAPPAAPRPPRFLPRTFLGFAVTVFWMGVAAAATGAVLYAYYEAKLDRTEADLDAFVSSYEDVFAAARAEIQADAAAAQQQIDTQLDELDRFAAGGETLTALLTAVEPSVWFVETLDDTGAPSVGSAFVVFADGEQSFLLTSYTAIEALTQAPVPELFLVKRDQRVPATLETWDPATDLALLRVQLPNLPPLQFVADPTTVQIGERLFAVSGLGANGAAISQGVVADVALNAISIDAGIGAAYQGGPLVADDGTVVAVASRAYNPAGPFDPLAVFYAPPIRRACEQVISCPDGQTPG